MNESPSDQHPVKHDPLIALRQPRFLLYVSSRVFSGTGQSMLQAVLAWHVYEITNSELSLGFLGLARFFPALGMSMIGGAVADTYNRRNIILVAQTVPLACGVVLAVSTLNGWVTPELIYGLVLLIGLASSFEGPARVALLPAIVRPETFANAVTVTSTLQTLGMVTGPLIGGAIIAGVDIGTSYVVYTILLSIALCTLLFLRYEQATGGPKREVSVAAIKEGIDYVFKRQPLLGAMSLDMFAVLFGGAKGLLPVYARDILDTGPVGYTILLSSLEIGAVVMSVALVLRPPIYRSGRALVYSVAVFGLLTMAFGISRNLYLSIALYMLIGAADEISVVMRNVIIQLTTPDELRGRVSSVNQVFIQASNQLGSMESGFLAAITSATFAVVSGGAAAFVIAGAIGYRMRELYDYVTTVHGAAHMPTKAHTADDAAAGGSGGSS
ncbi:MAG TPA: MFS transporter [Dehalococcoidia bacterium]|nr:MFS transporter [Dehalococcoidia bacterium]